MRALVLALALAAALKPASTPPKPAPSTPAAGSSKPLDIQADHLTVLTKDNRGLWKGHVHAVRAATAEQPKLVLTCDQLVTDFQGEDKLEKAVCTGNVEVVQGDRTGWGNQAIYDAAGGTVVVTGNPHGKQGTNEFVGDELTFFVDGDRIEVKNPKLKTQSPQQLEGSEKPKPSTTTTANAATPGGSK